MVFSSLIFLFWFIPIFFAAYYLCPTKYRNAVLFAGSIVFYAWGEPKYLILIFVSILVNYLVGILMSRPWGEDAASQGAVKKLILVCGLVFDFGMLFVFKYTGFFVTNINSLFNVSLTVPNIALPLGISFYTFQIVSYIVDLYNDKIKVEKNILVLGTYLVMFPQLIAGPIVVYKQVSEELHNRKITLENIEEGVSMFILGLASKVLIANECGALWNELSQIGYDKISMPLAWLGVLAYTLQIYFDFNGYSVMAIGLGKMLGFNIPRNFNYPYISKSITEFWRRWHITLSGWFREYIYIPLGGNRKGRMRTYLNLLIVWFLTGFWHGAGWNFILWGLFFFVILVMEKSFLGGFLDRHPHFARAYTLLLIGLSWMIFAITDFSLLGLYFTRLVSFEFKSDILFYLRNYAAVLTAGCVLSAPATANCFEKIRRKPAGIIVLLLLLFICICYLADASYNPFLYFRF